MEIVRKGEIIELDRVIEPAIATSLGDSILRIYREYCKRHYLSGDGTLYAGESPTELAEDTLAVGGTNLVNLSADSCALHRSLLDDFRQRAVDYVECAEPVVSGDFFIGRAAGGRWHIDGEFDYRELINLSEFPISLFVADEWGGTGLGSGWLNTILDSGLEPASYSQITYAPGEGVGINNYCAISEQVPHLGSSEEDKLFFRMIATNPDYPDFLRAMP
jgi:hypothetical protein